MLTSAGACFGVPFLSFREAFFFLSFFFFSLFLFFFFFSLVALFLSRREETGHAPGDLGDVDFGERAHGVAGVVGVLLSPLAFAAGVCFGGLLFVRPAMDKVGPAIDVVRPEVDVVFCERMKRFASCFCVGSLFFRCSQVVVVLYDGISSAPLFVGCVSPRPGVVGSSNGCRKYATTVLWI